MLEWTGERFLPWAGGSTLAYEHLHRYAFAATLVQGKRVLDLASGEGYGSRMLALTAASVIGVDVDVNAVQHATAKYSSDNLRFLNGSITAVPIPDSHSFDVIVCFEAIEHIENQDALLSEVKRLLTPEGVFFVSTPNKAIYHDASTEENPFHVKELYFEEFRELLGRSFQSIRFFGQRIHPGSSIWPVDTKSSGASQEIVLDRGKSEFEFIPADKRVALYFIAVASNSAAVLPSAGSILIDQSDSLFEEKDEQVRKSAAEARWREEQVTEREKAIASMEEALKWREGQVKHFESHIKNLNEALEWTEGRLTYVEKELSSREETIGSQEQALAWRADQVRDLQAGKEHLEGETTALRSQLQSAQQQLAIASDTLAGIYASRGWKLIKNLRGLRDRFKGPGKSRG